MNGKNAKEVLLNVERMLEEIEHRPNKRYTIWGVCEELSIFDWWPDYLYKSNLEDMRKFLREAIKLGYEGYVCFKVGMTGCANGMWAHKAESTTGYSPDGEALYKSFTPAYEYWSFCDDKECWYPGRDNYDTLNTIKKLENAIIDVRTKGE